MRETGRRVCGILGTVLVVPVVLLAMLLLAVRLCGLEVYRVADLCAEDRHGGHPSGDADYIFAR